MSQDEVSPTELRRQWKQAQNTLGDLARQRINLRDRIDTMNDAIRALEIVRDEAHAGRAAIAEKITAAEAVKQSIGAEIDRRGMKRPS